jgi:hypothetical protein
LHRIIQRLSPDYLRLSEFTQVIMSLDPQLPPLVTWDHTVLMRYWGGIATYLHWAGEPAQTVECREWVAKGIAAVGEAAAYIWAKNTAGLTGIMMPELMQPEIEACWESFRRGEIDRAAVMRIGNIALPVLKQRHTHPNHGPTKRSTGSPKKRASR